MSASREQQAPAPDRRIAWPALLALVLVPIIWGYNWVVMKSAMAYAGPFEFAALRYVPAGLLMLGAMALARRPLAIRPIGPVIAGGLLQIGANNAFSLFALRLGPAGRSALLNYTMPFWAVLLGWPLLRERPVRIQVVALGAAAAGLVLIFAATGASGNTGAVALAACSGVTWAMGAVLNRRLLARQGVDTMALTAWQNVFGGLSMAVAALILPGPPVIWSRYLVFALAYEVLPATAVAFVLWNALLKRVDAGVAGLAILAAPFLGLVSSAVQLGERPRGLEAAGMACLFVALVLVGPLAVRQARRRT